MPGPFDFTAAQPSPVSSAPRRQANGKALWITGGIATLVVAAAVLAIVLVSRQGSLQEEYEKRLLYEEWEGNNWAWEQAKSQGLPASAQQHFVDRMNAANEKAVKRFGKLARQLGEYPPTSHSQYDGVRRPEKP